MNMIQKFGEYVNESNSRPTKFYILSKAFNEAGFDSKYTPENIEIMEGVEDGDLRVDGEPIGFTIMENGTVIWNDFSHSTEVGNVLNYEELVDNIIENFSK